MKHYTKNCSVCGSPFTTKKKTTFTCSKNCASSLPRPAHHDPERIEARFWDHVEKLENGCWVWKATQHRKEYGQFYVHNKPVAAHRFSYELHYGQVPEGFMFAIIALMGITPLVLIITIYLLVHPPTIPTICKIKVGMLSAKRLAIPNYNPHKF
jgi:hypothetical protein